VQEEERESDGWVEGVKNRDDVRRKVDAGECLSDCESEGRSDTGVLKMYV